MRKLSALFVILAMLVVAVVPSFAQDEDATIADIVVASTEAEEPEFTVLLTAVGAADPSVLEALSNPDAELTVFAPTDAAFGALIEALGEDAFNEIVADTEALTNILLYHVVEGAVMAETVVGLEDDTEVPTLLEDASITVTFGDDGEVFVNDAEVIVTDIAAANGVIHVIDAVLVPAAGDDMDMDDEDMDDMDDEDMDDMDDEDMDDMDDEDMEDMSDEDMDDMMMDLTIGELVVAAAGDEEEPEFTYLLTAVGAASPAVLETLTDPEAELTVFAPTDAAFEALIEVLGEEAFNGLLESEISVTSILLYHVVDGKVYAEDVVALEDGSEVPTLLEGANLVVTFGDDNEVFVNGIQVLITDIETANGVIHVIDGVLVPELPE